jgi:hypothetical protein
VGPDFGHAGAVDRAGWEGGDERTTCPLGTCAGATVSVWTTRDGQLTSLPMGESQVTSLTDLGEIAGAVTVALLLAMVGVLARWSLDRRRMDAWEADWQSTGPRWTTRA